jgi:hypothetical protein
MAEKSPSEGSFLLKVFGKFRNAFADMWAAGAREQSRMDANKGKFAKKFKDWAEYK